MIERLKFKKNLYELPKDGISSNGNYFKINTYNN